MATRMIQDDSGSQNEGKAPKRKTRPWVRVPLTESWFFQSDNAKGIDSLEEFCEKVWIRSFQAQTLYFLAYLAGRIKEPSFSHVCKAYDLLEWSERPTERQVQDAIYALASYNLFARELNEGRTLCLRREVLENLETLGYCNPIPLLRKRFSE